MTLIYQNAGPRFLLLSQRLLAAIWLFNLARDPLWLLAQLPHDIYSPLGLPALLPHSYDDYLLSTGSLISIQAITIIGLVACFSPRFFTVASVISSLGLTMICSLDRSFGMMVRQDIPALLAFYALTGCAVAELLNKWMGTKSPTASRVPVVMIPALLCLTYFCAGISRAIIGGKAFFFTTTSSQYWIVYSALSGRYYNMNWGVYWPEHPWLMSGMPFVVLFATLVEISAPLCLIFPFYRVFFIPFMALFHLVTLFVMNIFFINNIFLLFWLVDWPEHISSFRQAKNTKQSIHQNYDGKPNT